MNALATFFDSMPLVLVTKVTLVLVLGHLAALALARAVPALRHRVWALTLVGALVLPLALVIVPTWRVAVLPPTPAVAAIAPAAVPATASRSPQPAAVVPAAVVARAPLAPVGHPQFSVNWPLLVWLTGLMLLLGWMAVGRLALRRIARRAHPLDQPRWLTLLEEERRRAGVSQPVRLLASPAASIPVTWGAHRPIVLLPAEADGWGEERCRVVLRHELAHIARGDARTQTLGALACAVYWFHPLAWLAARRMTAERERACDDRVLASGTPAAEYAAHLLDVARAARVMGAPALVSTAMARPSQLEGRLLAVLRASRPAADASRFARVAGIAAALGIVLVVSAFRPVPRRLAPTPQATTPVAPVRAASGDSTFNAALAAIQGGTLTLDLETGADVSITGWDRDSVRVQDRLAGSDRRQTKVTFERTADGVRLATHNTGTAESQQVQHRFEIFVPERYDVRLASAGGSVSLSGVDGDFVGHTGSGQITVDRASGHIALTTGGGQIRVTDSDLSGSVSTGGGGVELERVRGGLVGHTGSGGVVTADRGSAAWNRARDDTDWDDAYGARAAARAAADEARMAQREALDKSRQAMVAARDAQREGFRQADEALRATREQLEEAARDRDWTYYDDDAQWRELGEQLGQLGAQFGQFGRDFGRDLSRDIGRDLGRAFRDDDWSSLRDLSDVDPSDYHYERRVLRPGGAIDLSSAPGGAYVTTGDGSITVGSSDADVLAATGGGDIRLGPVTGSVVAHTGSGDVTIMITGAGAHSVDVVSGRGTAILELPAGLSARFELESAYTENFDHRTKIESAWPLKTTLTSDWDDSEGTPRRYVRASGTVGDGAGLIRVKVVNGDIIVRKR